MWIVRGLAGGGAEEGDRRGLERRGERAAAGVNVKVRAGVCVVAYTRVIDRAPLGSFHVADLPVAGPPTVFSLTLFS